MLLSNIATLISASASLIVALLTFRNTNLTKKSIEEMRIAREENSRPFIIAGYEVDERRIVQFYVENLGASPAVNVSVSLEIPIKVKREDGAVLLDIQKDIFDKPIKYIAPKEKIKTALFPTWVIPEEIKPYAENDVEITYSSIENKKQYKEKHQIGLKHYVESFYTDNYTMTDLVKQIKNLNETLENITKS